MIRLVSWLHGFYDFKRQDGMRQKCSKRSDRTVNMISNQKKRERLKKRCFKIAPKSTSPTLNIAWSESDPFLPPYSPKVFITETTEICMIQLENWRHPQDSHLSERSAQAIIN